MSAASAAYSSTYRLAFAAILLLALVSEGVRPKHSHAEIEAETHVRMDPGQSVMMLGRHNFQSTVSQEYVDHWFVLFCVDWLEHCQGLWHDYRNVASHWESSLALNASSWQNTAVRFAEVDCATDKALCNENHVDNYPSVVHFKGGKLLKAWHLSSAATSLSGDITKWIGKELSIKPVAKPKGTSLNVMSNIKEFLALLSWKDPTIAAAGYGLLAMLLLVVAWIINTGFEPELKSLVGEKSWPSLLPEMKDMGTPRTIVRSSIVL